MDKEYNVMDNVDETLSNVLKVDMETDKVWMPDFQRFVGNKILTEGGLKTVLNGLYLKYKSDNQDFNNEMWKDMHQLVSTIIMDEEFRRQRMLTSAFIRNMSVCYYRMNSVFFAVLLKGSFFGTTVIAALEKGIEFMSVYRSTDEYAMKIFKEIYENAKDILKTKGDNMSHNHYEYLKDVIQKFGKALRSA